MLLHWLHAEAAVAGITTAALDIEYLGSPATLIRAIRIATRCFARVREWISPLKAEYRGFKIGVAGGGEASPLAHALKRGKGEILPTLDEAREASTELLGLLFRAAQIAGENRPVAIVFADTPDLETALQATRASFWSRGRTLCIGLLGTTARERR